MDDTPEDGSTSDRKYVSVVYHHISYHDSSPGDDVRGGGKGQVNMVSSYEPTVDIPDYLPLTSFSILIFIPLGILGVLSSLEVRKAIKMSDAYKARQASDKALQQALSAIFVGPICFLFIFLCVYMLYNTI